MEDGEKRIKAIHSFIREEDRAMDGQLTARAHTAGWDMSLVSYLDVSTTDYYHSKHEERKIHSKVGLAMKI